MALATDNELGVERVLSRARSGSSHPPVIRGGKSAVSIEQRVRALGLTDLFVEVFGEQDARSAIGVGSLPFGVTVDIEAIVEVE